MPISLTCSQGHTWEVAENVRSTACPVCTEPVTLPGTADTVTRQPSTGHYTLAHDTARIAAPTAEVPGYEIIAELGRGGMGVVYKARQVKADRIVALKMVLSGQFAGERERAQFRTEAEAAARLSHANIVQIYEVDEHDGRPFFSLEFCAAGSLATKLQNGPLPPREAAAIAEQLARAMSAAHAAKIIHRDLKPANVLITADGTAKITDFGIAKKLDAGEGHTATGAVFGTPPYMAPEQASGRNRDVGPSTDVYALGAILYEMLTGRPPFQGASVLETLDQVCNREPVSPRVLQPKVPRDLETICLKCLRKEAGKRYGSAEDLAEELRRWQAGEPIQARPVGRVERTTKWVKRHPVETFMGGMIVLALAAGVTGIWLKYRDAKEQEGIAKDKARELGIALEERDGALRKVTEQEGIVSAKARDLEAALGERDKALTKAQEEERRVHEEKLRTEAREEQTRHLLDISQIQLAQEALHDGASDVAIARLETVRPSCRLWDWHFLRRQCEGGLFTCKADCAGVGRVAYSSDGSRLATGGRDNISRVWDARTGKLLLLLRAHTGPVFGIAFSPDNSLIATASGDSTARMWDGASGRPICEFRGHSAPVYAVAFNPEGTFVATACDDGAVRIWDPRTGALRLELPRHPRGVHCITYSPDGSRLAAGFDKSVRVWEIATQRLVTELVGSKSMIEAVRYSPDGARLVTASQDRMARLWDAQNGTLLLELKGHTAAVWDAVFCPDGSQIVTASFDRTARVWDSRTGSQVFVLNGHNKNTGVAFSPEGLRVATGSDDGCCRIWECRTGSAELKIVGHTTNVDAIAYSSEGEWIATAANNYNDHSVRLWDCRNRTPILVSKFPGSLGYADVAFCPDSSRLVAVLGGRAAQVIDIRSGKRELALAHSSLVTSVAWSSSGELIATSSADKSARLWNSRDGRMVRELRGHTKTVFDVQFSPDSACLATGSADATVRIWDTQSGRRLQELKGHEGAVVALSFDPTGSHIATASVDATARIWATRTGAQRLVLRGHAGPVRGVAFSPDGFRLATVGDDYTMRTWDLATGQPVIAVKHTFQPRRIVFSPDGNWITTSGGEPLGPGEIRMWDARPVDPDILYSDESFYRLQHTRPEPNHHNAELTRFEKANDRFAAAFHLDRLLAYQPDRRPELLRKREQSYGNYLSHSRAAVHSPVAIPDRKKHTATVLFLALQRKPLELRTLGGLLIRDNKPTDAIAPLKSALLLREGDRPPVEELLLALAFADMKQPDEAKRWLDKAALWLDRYKTPFQITSALGCAPSGPLFAATEMVKRPLDPRYNPFDWETWHECDVFRDEVEAKLKAR